jgi:hypothetical protein
LNDPGYLLEIRFTAALDIGSAIEKIRCYLLEGHDLK